MRCFDDNTAIEILAQAFTSQSRAGWAGMKNRAGKGATIKHEKTMVKTLDIHYGQVTSNVTTNVTITSYGMSGMVL